MQSNKINLVSTNLGVKEMELTPSLVEGIVLNIVYLWINE